MAPGGWTGQPIPLNEAEHLIVIGSDRMMQAVGVARRGVLAPYLRPGHTAIGSINSPMQCMMKEVCAQCLQPQIDPETGARTVIFSCFNQDQPLDRVDFPALNERLRQNCAAGEADGAVDRPGAAQAQCAGGGGGVKARKEGQGSALDPPRAEWPPGPRYFKQLL